MDRERAAKQHRPVVTAHRHGHELPGTGLLGDARRDDGHREVGAGLLHRQHFTADLHRRHQPAPPRKTRIRLWCSCNGATPTSPLRNASMPCTAAASACTVVRHGTPRITAAVRISYPSRRGPELPKGVLTMRSTSPAAIRSTTGGSPSGPRPAEFLRTVVATTPFRRSTSAVPAVASTSNPRSASLFTGNTMCRLSRLATETKTRPFVGSGPYAASCDFAKAVPNPS